MDVHQIELPVTFKGGVGTTQTISSEEVWLTTRHVLGIGQRIDGTLCFPPAPDGVATVLRFAAFVAMVAPSLEGDGIFEVWARFERIAFGAIIVEHKDGSDAVLPRKREENPKSPLGYLGASSSIEMISRHLSAFRNGHDPAQGASTEALTPSSGPRA